MQTNPTSASVMFTYIADRNVDNMIAEPIIAIVLISRDLMLRCRSVRLGLLSLVPNGLPILAPSAPGRCWSARSDFSVATSRRSRSASSSTTRFTCCRNTFAPAASAAGRQPTQFDTPSERRCRIVVNTVILAAGFLVLSDVELQDQRRHGLLTALAIVFA